MAKMVQIRNVPDDLHRRWKVRAAEQGLTLSEYLLRAGERDIERPTIEEVLERIRRRGPASMTVAPSTLLRRMRDAS